MATIICYNNHVEGSTLTAGSADGSYPASNIQLVQTTKEWRTASATTTSTLVIDFGSAKAVDYFFLLGNALESVLNFTSITLEANTTASWGAPAYSSGAITSFPENLLFLALGSTQTYQYWRVSVTNGAGGATFAGFSNLFLGQALSLPNNNIDTSWKLQRTQKAETVEGLYGQRFVTPYNTQDTFQVGYQLVNPTERAALRAFFEDRGVSKPFWMVLDSEEGITLTKEELAGYFWLNESPEWEHTSYGLYSTELSITQVI